MQGCDAIKTYTYKTMPSYNDATKPGYYPVYPTRVLYYNWTVPSGETLPGGTKVSVPLPSTYYDCSTWAAIQTNRLAVGAKVSSAGTVSEITETKTVLAQSGSTATQNFAFEVEE